MARAARNISTEICWYAQRRCFRFAYRDPCSGRRRFILCVPDKFTSARIALPDPSVVRRNTKTGLAYAKQLQTAFMRSLASLRAETESTAPPTISGTIAAYFDLYEKSPSYRKSLTAIFTEFLSVVGDKQIDRVTDLDIKSFETAVAKRCGRTTVRSYLAQLGMLLHFARRKGWLRQDPRLTYKPPKPVFKEPNPFTLDELRAFFDVVRGQPHLEWMGIGYLFLGLRPIELEHARWENVNFDHRFLFIARSHPHKMPQACQNQPIPLAAWPGFLARRKSAGLVWTTSTDGPWTPDAQARARRTLRRTLPTFMWKRFRKTYATILEQAGNDIVTVSRLLRQSAGGKNVTVAQRHYIGKSQEFLRSVVDEAFESLPGGGALRPGPVGELFALGRRGRLEPLGAKQRLVVQPKKPRTDRSFRHSTEKLR